MTQSDINHSSNVSIPCEGKLLEGSLELPRNMQGIIVFAHGSGSSRFSVRNQLVARKFNEAKFGTLLFDLLTPEEGVDDVQHAKFRFNIPFLSKRLVIVTEWLTQQSIAHGLPIGFFGASTGAAAAISAAAALPNLIKAVVSRGGRPDLAMDELPLLKAPTLLIVGGEDKKVIELNETALHKLIVTRRLDIVPGASHLFEEPGTLQAVARLAAAWFSEYLVS